MSIRINAVPPKTGEVTENTKIATEASDDESNKTRALPAPDVTPDTWGVSDEDSPLSTGILYTTEAAPSTRSIKKVFASLKNPPGGLPLTIDIEKEDAVDSNTFTTILSTLITILVGTYSTKNAGTPPVVTGGEVIWNEGERLRIRLVTNDTSFEATGAKVGVKS